MYVYIHTFFFKTAITAFILSHFGKKTHRSLKTFTWVKCAPQGPVTFTFIKTLFCFHVSCNFFKTFSPCVFKHAHSN